MFEGRWNPHRDHDPGHRALWVYIEGPLGVHRVRVDEQIYTDMTRGAQRVPDIEEPSVYGEPWHAHYEEPSAYGTYRTHEDQTDYIRRIKAEQARQEARRQAEERIEKERADKAKQARDEQARAREKPSASWTIFTEYLDGKNRESFFRIFEAFSEQWGDSTQTPPKFEHKTSKPRVDPGAKPASRAAALDELRKIAKGDTQPLTDKQLYHRAMRQAHPDHGGTHDQAVRVDMLRVYLGIK